MSVLRPAMMSDSEDIMEIRTDVRDYLCSPFYGNDVKQDEWMRHVLLDDTKIIMVMEDRYGEVFGYGILHDIDHIHKKCMGQVQVDAEYRGEGHGTAMWKELIRISMDDLGMNKIYLEVLVDNAPAIYVYSKLGFELEGTLRRHYWHDGKWAHVHILALHRETCDGQMMSKYVEQTRRLLCEVGDDS